MKKGSSMSPSEIAEQLVATKENVILIYAFNSTGKTRLSVAYKDATKRDDGSHAGVYYNAFSEDLFSWDNDSDNNEENICLSVKRSSLNKFHVLLSEDTIRESMRPYSISYDFQFNLFENPEEGIESISFFSKEESAGSETPSIKISRGEERIFVWCFFLALFSVEGWADKQSEHFFIDDPVSSLDDHNIFVTAYTILDLIENHFQERKIILTTHHLGMFSILFDWLKKGEKKSKFEKHVKCLILNSRTSDGLELENCTKDVFLYHLRLLQLLERARSTNEVSAYHFALLRQVLENIASFLGVGQFSYVLQQIGIGDPERVANIVNTLSHKKVYYYESDQLVPDNRNAFDEIVERLKQKYNFVLHAG
jgi:hypothetical protein